jgi:hypothetical protein
MILKDLALNPDFAQLEIQDYEAQCFQKPEQGFSLSEIRRSDPVIKVIPRKPRILF